MNPHTIYDYLIRSRQRILDLIRSLDAVQYAREFQIGCGTIGATMTHIVISEWYYVERMQQREVPPYAQWSIQSEHPPPFTEIESFWIRQADATRRALQAVRDWNAAITYRVTLDDGSPIVVTTSAAGLFTQLAFHEVHHRAQVMNMLRHLGLDAGDIDFNAMMYERRPAEGA